MQILTIGILSLFAFLNAYGQGGVNKVDPDCILISPSAIPAGTYQVTVPADVLPQGYRVKSITSGSTDLLRTPLTVSGTEPAVSIHITLGVSTPPPWVKVSGHVLGMRPSETLSIHVSVSGGGTKYPDFVVMPDGSFEFPMMLPGNYTASLWNGARSVASGIRILVPNQDVVGLEISR